MEGKACRWNLGLLDWKVDDNQARELESPGITDIESQRGKFMDPPNFKSYHVSRFFCQAPHAGFKGRQLLSAKKTGRLSKTSSATATAAFNSGWKTNHYDFFGLLTTDATRISSR